MAFQKAMHDEVSAFTKAEHDKKCLIAGYWGQVFCALALWLYNMQSHVTSLILITLTNVMTTFQTNLGEEERFSCACVEIPVPTNLVLQRRGLMAEGPLTHSTTMQEQEMK